MSLLLYVCELVEFAQLRNFEYDFVKESEASRYYYLPCLALQYIIFILGNICSLGAWNSILDSFFEYQLCGWLNNFRFRAIAAIVWFRDIIQFYAKWKMIQYFKRLAYFKQSIKKIPSMIYSASNDKKTNSRVFFFYFFGIDSKSHHVDKNGVKLVNSFRKFINFVCSPITSIF